VRRYKQVPSWLLLLPLSSSEHWKIIDVNANVIMRYLRENENTEYIHNWILETECMSFGFVSERIAGWKSLAQYRL